MKKIILGVITLIIIGGIVIKFKEKEGRLEVDPIKQVTVEIVERKTMTQENVFGSFVKNSEEAMLSAQLGGIIDKFYINEGVYVKKGQVIAHISAPEISAQYAQVNAQVEISEQEEKLARRKWDDYKPEEREQFKLQNKQARASRAEVAATLGKATIRAPFSGIVSKKFTEEGSTILPGMQVAYLVGNNKEKELEIAVPVNVGKNIVVGEIVSVKSEGVEEEAKIMSVNPVSDNVSRKMSIKVSLRDDSTFSLGTFVDVVFSISDSGASKGISIPKSAVIKKYDNELVFVLDNRRACLQSIEIIGEHKEDRIFVTGIDSGTKVVTSGVHSLRDCEQIVIEL